MVMMKFQKGVRSCTKYGDCGCKRALEAKLNAIERGSPCELEFFPPLSISETLRDFIKTNFSRRSGLHTIYPSTEAISQKDIEGAQNLLRIAIHVVLPLRAVNTIILASDDLQDILPYDDPLLKKCVDPLDSLARSTVKLAQSVIQSF
ncbi:probable amino-acid racemase [Tanacetum coccineum]